MNILVRGRSLCLCKDGVGKEEGVKREKQEMEGERRKRQRI